MSERECDNCGGFLVWADGDEVYRCHSCGAEEQAATDGQESGTPRLGVGALVMKERNGRYYHVLNHYRDLEDGHIEYRITDATHTHYYNYRQEDLLAEFRPAGISLNLGVKPAGVFGGRVGGKLVGWRNIWEKPRGEPDV